MQDSRHNGDGGNMAEKTAENTADNTAENTAEKTADNRDGNSGVKYVTHPLIRPGSLEERKYQIAIAVHATEDNTLVVLPTGLGKTAVALLVTAMRLRACGGKILMMAPTKPLVDQHLKMFSDKLIEPDGDRETMGSGFALFTGETPTDERKEMWKSSRVIFATPQVIKNDIIAGRYSLKDVSLLIVDECHRAVGNYAYVFIAEEYMKTGKNPLILAMTASPGSKEEKLMDVCYALSVKIVETRTEENADVKPYIHEREIKYVDITLPPELEHAVIVLKKLLDMRLKGLGELGYIVPSADKLTMAALNSINVQIQRKIAERNTDAFLAASVHAEIMKIRHAVTLAESQGSEILKAYLNKLSAEGMSPSGTKASQRLCRDELFVSLLKDTDTWEYELLPKFEKTFELVSTQLGEYPESRIIIFANFRDTVTALCDYLVKRGVDARKFIGQASKDSVKGLTQKKQIETLGEFRDGVFKVLIATSVGEEGLDVPSTDMVIFYESVPSEVRSIQRKGRTGRHGSGTIYVLITKGTTDETFTHVSRVREKAMTKGIRSLSATAASGGFIVTTPMSGLGTGNGTADKGQSSITAFTGGNTENAASVAGAHADNPVPLVIADDREGSSKVVEALHRSGISMGFERLEFGDYAIGDRILVERKTARDFTDTLVERDLIGQIKRMADAAIKPVLIIEGEDLYTQRNINPNAVRGALCAISIGMGVSIFRTKTPEETADLLCVMAKREDNTTEGGLKSPHFHKTYRSKREQLEYIVSAFPGTGLKNARILLGHFGSIENIVNASEEELRAVNGIGEVSAKKIYETARERYTEF
jgi:Fanconi anemia group M protein